MSEAEAAKARGNAAFQSGQLDVAIREFSAAIEVAPSALPAAALAARRARSWSR